MSMRAENRPKAVRVADEERGYEEGHLDPATLLAEMNHRISNNLALVTSLVRRRITSISRSPADMTGQEVVNLLNDIAAKIETVALLHRLLSERPDANEVDVCGYLRRVCDAIASTSGPTAAFDLSALANGCPVLTEKVIPVGLIVDEIVTNALKYAQPSGTPVRIGVACYRASDGTVVVEVMDNGPGLPEALDPEIDGGFGFRMIHALCDQIDARCEFSSSPQGLHFRLRLTA